MKKSISYLLWAGLGLFLLLSLSGIMLRMGNEARNTTVIAAADFKEFTKTADAANVSMDSVLSRLKGNGVTNIGVKEVTLRDLAYRGDISITSYGEFKAFNQVNAPAVWAAARQATGDAAISPANLVVTTTSDITDNFLRERLGNRFLPRQLFRLSMDGKIYYIINAPLTQLDKRKEAKPETDASLGFENNILAMLKSRGFNIILRPENNTGNNLAYLSEYDRIIADYKIHTILFGNAVPGNPDHLAAMENLVKNHHLMVGIIETPEQIQYIKQPGLDQLILDTSYPINRVHSSADDEFAQIPSEKYYRWVRTVIDRGGRLLYVSPFNNTKVAPVDNLNSTIDMAGKFNQTMASKGFVTQGAPPDLSAQMPSQKHRLAVSLSLLLAGILYLYYLCRPRKAFIYLLLLAGAAAAVCLNIFLKMDLDKLHALTAALLYPSFSSLMLLLYVRNTQAKSLGIQILSGLGIIVGINMLGMYTIVTSLSDIRYIMNVGIFSGVKVAFILPLLLFLINYLFCFPGEKGIINKVFKLLQTKPSYLILLLLMAGAAAGYYYLGRSGNAVVAVSSLELKAREILENIFLARPRFKEFIIGYPALFVMIYLYRKYKNELVLPVLGLAVVIGSISMVNSFCHVFTAVATSINRTLAGIVLGIPLGLLAIVLVWLLMGAYEKFIRPQIQD